MPLSVSADPSIGSELLGYRIEEVIGRGGMGVVFRAVDLRLERNVALKLLVPELASDQRFRERFLRESVLLAALDHPNVIPIYDAGEADGRLFIAMRYVEGGDLGGVLRAGPLEPEQALGYCSQVADALDAAHERGLVHRDVKPSNVLLDERKHVYLADFGLTRRVVGGDAQGMEALRSLGTIDYIAPEQIRGEEIDGRADLYSLACLLYECLTGEPPFRRPSDLAVAFAHLEEEPVAPPALDGLTRKALAKAPGDRFQSGDELVGAARSILGLDAPQRRRWPAMAAVVVLALVAVGALSFLLTRSGSAGAAPLSGRLLRIDPRGNRVTNTVDVGSDPNAVAADDNHVWVSTQGSLWQIDEHSLAAQSFPATPVGVAVSGGFVYAPDSNGGVIRLDAATGKQLESCQTSAGGAITNNGRVWFVEELTEVGAAFPLGSPSRFVCKGGRHVKILDPRPLDEAHVRFGFAGVAAGAHDVWVAGDALDRRVFQIERNKVVAIDLPFAPGGIARGRDGVWVTGQDRDVLARIDPTTRHVRITHVGRDPTGVAVGDGSVWVANTLDRSIWRINPASGRVVKIRLKVSPKALTVTDAGVWVAASAR